MLKNKENFWLAKYLAINYICDKMQIHLVAKLYSYCHMDFCQKMRKVAFFAVYEAYIVL